MSNTQKLSIRLLRDGLAPADAVRDGVDLTPWDKLEGALIALATLGGGSPKWARFLELSEEEKKKVLQELLLCQLIILFCQYAINDSSSKI